MSEYFLHFFKNFLYVSQKQNKTWNQILFGCQKPDFFSHCRMLKLNWESIRGGGAVACPEHLPRWLLRHRSLQGVIWYDHIVIWCLPPLTHRSLKTTWWWWSLLARSICQDGCYVTDSGTRLFPPDDVILVSAPSAPNAIIITMHQDHHQDHHQYHHNWHQRCSGTIISDHSGLIGSLLTPTCYLM